VTELEATSAPLSATSGCVVVGVIQDHGCVSLAPGAEEVSESFGAALRTALERFGVSGCRRRKGQARI
jgi:hypothetical protein